MLRCTGARPWAIGLPRKARGRRLAPGAARLQDAAVLHHDHAVGDGEGLLAVLRRIDGRTTQAAQQPGNSLAQALAQVAVEAGQGFVQQHQARALHHGAGQRRTLLLAARQAAGKALAHALQPDQAQGLLHPLVDLRARQAAHFQREGHVGLQAHMGPERMVLGYQAQLAPLGRQGLRGAGHALPAHPDFAAAGLLQPGQDLEQGGLAAARRTQQGQHLAGGDLQTDVLEHGALAVDALELPGGRPRPARRPWRIRWRSQGPHARCGV